MRPLTKIAVFGVRLGIVILVVYWIAMFLGTHLPKVPTITDASDKTKHFWAYFGLTFLLCYVTSSRPVSRRFAKIGAIALAYGVFDELSQYFVPRRQPDVADLFADALGIIAAISVYAAARYLYYRSSNKGD